MAELVKTQGICRLEEKMRVRVPLEWNSWVFKCINLKFISRQGLPNIKVGMLAYSSIKTQLNALKRYSKECLIFVWKSRK